MDINEERPEGVLVLIANDDPSALAGQVTACESAGLHVVSSGVGAVAFELTRSAAPSVFIISLATDAGLRLVQELARDPRTSHIPVVVTASHSEHARVRAEQSGSVAVFLEQHSLDTLVSAVKAVAGLRDLSDDLQSEFPARCPSCDTRGGMPRSVSTAARSGTYVGLECENCGQGWRILRPGAARA